MTAPPRLDPAQTAGRAAPRTVPSPMSRQDHRTTAMAPPIHLVPTLIGAVAVLAATLAIPPMISGGSWFWQTVEVVMVVWLVGVGARLARAPAAVSILLQLAGAAVALTALFTTGGFGGVIPNGAVIGEAGELLTGAWDQIRTTISPAPSSTELAFLISLAVGATALIVDILIAQCRAPALVALPLLCVYSVPASIDLGMLPWEAFAAPAMLYAILLTASGLSGRRIGPGAGVAQVVTGLGLASLATVIALLVAGSVTGVGTAGRLPRTDAGPSAGIGLSPFASLSGNLQRSEPVDMLTVSGLQTPRYLRTIGLQRWTTGVGWSVDDLTDGPLPDSPNQPEEALVSISALNYRDQFLPIYEGTTSLVGIDQGWSYDAALQTVHRADAVTPGPYTIAANLSQPTAEELRADSVVGGGLLTETDDLPTAVVDLATTITAGATTPFDKANALNTYFTDPANGFSYSLNVPEGDSGDKLVDFLTLKQGYCEQYASAMGIMLRAVGVPARVAIGFTQGTQAADGSYLISSNDAHAWVEVPFVKSGWVQFDPTPLGGGQGGQQGFTDTGEAAPTTSVSASAVPSLEAGADEPTPEPLPQAGQTAGGAGQAAAAEEPVIPAALWWVLGILVVVVAAASGPTLVRRQRRNHRLAAADAGGPGAAAAAWREIEDLAVDHGIGLNPAESARATANRMAKTAHLAERGRLELRTVVAQAEHGWYSNDDSPVDPPDPVMSGPASPGAEAPASVGGSGHQTAATSKTQHAALPLGAAPRTMALELEHNAPLSPLERLVPRSVRPSWWRD